MNRLWVIECKFSSGGWTICDFAEKQFAYTNYYDAHRIKKEIQGFLFRTGSNHWTKNKFRVVEYTPKKGVK